MTWSNTVKDFKTSTVFKELPAIFKRSYPTFIPMVTLLAGVIVCSTTLIPLEWRVDSFAFIFCPILLASCQCVHLFSLSLLSRSKFTDLLLTLQHPLPFPPQPLGYLVQVLESRIEQLWRATEEVSRCSMGLLFRI